MDSDYVEFSAEVPVSVLLEIPREWWAFEGENLILTENAKLVLLALQDPEMDVERAVRAVSIYSELKALDAAG